MSTALQERSQSEGKLATWVERPEVHDRIAAAVGDIMDADQFIAHAMVAFQDPKVKSCTPLSQFTALHQLAALGLLPTLGQVALVPYKDSIKCSPQWQGFKALMERHPSVLEVQAVIVHKNDSFRFHNGEVIHDYDPFDMGRQIKSVDDIKGGYCKIIYRDGRPPKYHIVTAEHIGKCRRCAETQNVWNKWPEQMILKTLYRDCYARRAVPMDPLVHARLQAVVQADDIDLGNNPNRVGNELPPADQEEPKSRTERLADFLSCRTTHEETALPDPLSNDATTREREPGDDSEPIPSVDHGEESAIVAQWREAAAGAEKLKDLADLRTRLPKISDEGRNQIISAIEMREATIRGSRGDRSGQRTMIDGVASATEAGM